LRLDLIVDIESGYLSIILDILKRWLHPYFHVSVRVDSLCSAMICSRDCAPSSFDAFHSLHLQVLRIRYQE
jgi:hypothetical protein